MFGIPARLSDALSGRYRIERELGAGGMATVYLAHDVRHDRQVAIKVLKPELAAVLGAERFVQEIKTTAALSHPHILPLFDSGEADGFLYYVMPYLQGETIREKLNRETQFGIEEAVKIAIEVADALHYAHQHGVIHRDIKPENILLHAGRPMVMDFGIALAVSAAAGSRMTETGLSLGTPQYMSPEQATAEKGITGRSDIYSLASVVYEMLTGVPPHEGGSAQQTIMRIIADAARPIRELRKNVPPNVAFSVMKALEKLPADRFESAAKFAEALATASYRNDGTVAASAYAARTTAWRQRAPWGVSALLAAVLLGLAAQRDPPRVAPPVRFSVSLGPDSTYRLGTTAGRPSRPAIAFSPDGTQLVAVVTDSERSLYRRRMNAAALERIPGTDGAFSPFFSADGRWIGFFAANALKRVSVDGGTPETIIDNVPWVEGVSWGDDGAIVFGTSSQIVRLPPGGSPEPLFAEADTSGAIRYGMPDVLPGSNTVLFQRWRSSNPRDAEILAFDRRRAQTRVVLKNGMHPRYSPTGHLIFAREGKLLGVAFDAERAVAVGEPVVVVEDVMQSLLAPNSGQEVGAAQFALSARGDLAYASGGVWPEDRAQIARVGTDGRLTAYDAEVRGYWSLRASPDETRIASHAGPGAKNDLFVYDGARGVTQHLSVGGFSNRGPTWSPDGRMLAFTSDRDGVPNIYRIDATGSGDPVRLAPSTRLQAMSSWSRTGVIAFLEDDDIWVLPPDSAPRRFLQSNAHEADATFSPDGRWLAFRRVQAGRSDIVVHPYPGPGTPTLIATGGTNPAWAADGRTLFYVEEGATGTTLMAVDISTQAGFRAGRARRVMPFPWCCTSPVRGFDVLRDGSFLVSNSLPVDHRPARELHVVLQFGDELRRLSVR